MPDLLEALLQISHGRHGDFVWVFPHCFAPQGDIEGCALRCTASSKGEVGAVQATEPCLRYPPRIFAQILYTQDIKPMTLQPPDAFGRRNRSIRRMWFAQ